MQITKDESGLLKISGSLDISEAAGLQHALREFVETAAAPVLDLSQVDACDTASIQLLCSARKTAGQMSKLFAILGPADAVRQTAEGLGLSLAELGAEVHDSAVA